ncbi:TetR/AcrR family transcriptional regulator [Nocardia yamanashiensis]|uniref:TetR/AcrR family transcriptional regulator n=1 Tax=Nocardia yamanashiensis TaxID=209247 RepID=UPI001E524041|nr:TetR/AcrR family transcriptional regulator [Nocardia yamanashiensis]UGT41204.1 TetR/AcrR family transcriptional regulator [Nocardia yamanashiensis]
MTRTRMTATERGEQVLQAAITAFAESGYAATKTDEIARRAGVSQPYVIRLFGTKQQLFLAVLARVCDRIDELFRAAVEELPADTPPQERLHAMGRQYKVFLAERDLPRVFLQGLAAAGVDPEIGRAIRARFGNIYTTVRDLTGAPVLAVRQFMATGMLLTDMAAMGVTDDGAADAPWAQEILADIEAAGD